MGLIKTGLKAAVAVKVGHMVHDRIERRQRAEWAAGGHPAGTAAPPAQAPVPQAEVPQAPVPQAPAPAPPVAAAVPAPAPPVNDVLAQLTQLGELRTAGVLTDAEFEAQKARILNG
jgi:hypothetical protein